MRVYDNGIYRDATAEEIAMVSETPKDLQIEALKAELSATDYKAIKYAEGLISAIDYAPIKAEREAIRARINALESEL